MHRTLLGSPQEFQRFAPVSQTCFRELHNELQVGGGGGGEGSRLTM